MGQPKAKTMIERAGFKDDDLKTPEHDQIMMWLDQNAEEVINRLFPEAWPDKIIEEVQREFLTEIQKCRSHIETMIRGLNTNLQQALEAKAQREAQGLVDILSIHYTQPDYESDIVKATAKLDLISEWISLDQPPPRPVSEVVQKQWEYTIANDRAFVVGFIDMMIRIKKPTLYVNFNRVRDYDLPSSKPVCEIFYSDENVYFEVKSKIPSLGELVRQIRFYQSHKPGRYYVVSPDERYADLLRSQGIGFVSCPSFSKAPPQGSLF